MAYTGLWLKGARGKFAGGVLQNSPGGTILRENVKPSNPQTRAQVETRTGFKLMSQLAASLAPVIAIRREGALSPRNVFVKTNWPLVFLNGDEAQITYENIQLTKSQRSIGDISLVRSGSDVAAEILSAVSPDIKRVVFVAYYKNTEGSLTYINSYIAPVNQATHFADSVTFDAPENKDVIVFAYGMVDNSAEATYNYGNLQVESGADIVKLMSNGTLSAADYSFTRTRGTTIFAGESENAQISSTQARLYVTASGPGTVSGGGIKTIGSSVTVVATPNNSNIDFLGWYKNDNSNTLVSSQQSYTFTMPSTTVDLVAKFDDDLIPQTP